VLFVCFRADGAHHLRPILAPALRLGWGPDRDPAQIVIAALEALQPLAFADPLDVLASSAGAVVGEALAAWVVFLDRYEPEPFRALGPPR
jgi:hypothetical protein